VTVNSITQSTSWVTDHWEVTLNGLTLGLGVYSVVVDVDAFGYEPNTDSFDVNVNAIPASVIVDSVTFTVFPFDSVTVSFTWFDDKNTVGIAGYAPDVIWPDTFSVIDHGNGSYSIELDSNALHVGFYDLNVTFTRVGYSVGFRTVSIEVLELPIVLIFDDTIEEYENETVTVAFSIYDGPHANVVDWGEIVIELEGRQYQLGYNPGTQEYSGSIWLGSLAPGIYTINFTATAIDCETEYGEIQLEIIPKRTYTLLIEVDDEIQAGQSIEIIIQASDESGPMEGLSVSVHIIVERGQSAPQEFIEVASDLLEFHVPSDATGLTIWAEFEGTVEEWPAISNTVNRDVSPGSIDPLAFDPITLAIVVGAGGGSIAGLIFLRRRRHRASIPSTSITDPVVTPTTTPTAPAGEMEMLQEKIKEHPDGLTRNQVAQSLEITTSKARAMVKHLLGSELGFEEIR